MCSSRDYLWICVVPLKCNNILLECLLSNMNGDRLFRHMPLGVNTAQYDMLSFVSLLPRSLHKLSKTECCSSNGSSFWESFEWYRSIGYKLRNLNSKTILTGLTEIAFWVSWNKLWKKIDNMNLRKPTQTVNNDDWKITWKSLLKFSWRFYFKSFLCHQWLHHFDRMLMSLIFSCFLRCTNFWSYCQIFRLFYNCQFSSEKSKWVWFLTKILLFTLMLNLLSAYFH